MKPSPMPTPLRLILRSAVGFSESILRAIVGTHLPTSKLVSFLFIQLQEFDLTSIRFSKNIEVIWLILRVECEELSEEAVEILKEVRKLNECPVMHLVGEHFYHTSPACC